MNKMIRLRDQVKKARLFEEIGGINDRDLNRVKALVGATLLLTLQQLCLLLALMFVDGSCVAATEDAVSVSGEAQVQLVRRRLHTREYRGIPRNNRNANGRN